MNTLSNQTPSPTVFQIILRSPNVGSGSNTDGFYRVNIPQVVPDKQYYIEVSRIFIQDIDNPNIQQRMVRMVSNSVIQQNTYDTYKDGFTNVLGQFELQHDGAGHYVAWVWNPVSEMLSGGFVNGSMLNNGQIHIRFEYLDRTAIAFTGGSAYAGWEAVLTVYEVYNHDINAVFRKVLSEPSLKTQVQGATHSK
jgi:hypothetical protein